MVGYSPLRRDDSTFDSEFDSELVFGHRRERVYAPGKALLEHGAEAFR